MEYHGTIQGGMVILNNGAAGLPDGTPVRVTTVEAIRPDGTSLTPTTDANAPMPAASELGARLLKFAGRAKGLPSDSARNHDHYLYGTPKR